LTLFGYNCGCGFGLEEKRLERKPCSATRSYRAIQSTPTHHAATIHLTYTQRDATFDPKYRTEGSSCLVHRCSPTPRSFLSAAAAGYPDNCSHITTRVIWQNFSITLLNERTKTCKDTCVATSRSLHYIIPPSTLGCQNSFIIRHRQDDAAMHALTSFSFFLWFQNK
jgi:hypothetical protein